MCTKLYIHEVAEITPFIFSYPVIKKEFVFDSSCQAVEAFARLFDWQLSRNTSALGLR